MSDDEQVTALLTRLAEQWDAPVAPPMATFIARARRHRPKRNAVIAVVVVAVVAVGARHATGVSHPPSTVFGAPTGDALVFDDGGNGVATVDLDHRSVANRVIEGQQAGNQPWRLTVSGSDLIVGYGQVFAAPLAGGASRLLGAATISLPATEAGDVWLASWQGGAIGQGSLRVQEVTTGGRTVIPARSPSPNLGVPAVGIPGGLAFQSDHGLLLWNAVTGQVTKRLGSGQGEVGLPNGNWFAWCDGACSQLHLTNLASGANVEVSAPAGRSDFDAPSARFSPDGTYLAVVADGPGPPSVVVIDTVTGRARIVAEAASMRAFLGWAPDGSRLFFASPSDRDTSLLVGEFTVKDGRTKSATIPADLDGSALVVVPLTEAHGLLVTFQGLPDECRAGNNLVVCGYRF